MAWQTIDMGLSYLLHFQGNVRMEFQICCLFFVASGIHDYCDKDEISLLHHQNCRTQNNAYIKIAIQIHGLVHDYIYFPALMMMNTAVSAGNTVKTDDTDLAFQVWKLFPPNSLSHNKDSLIHLCP